MARRQLLDLGFGSRSIERRISRGRLHLIGRGIYAVGRPELSQEQRWMAAVLACGDGAMLSHRSAAALWGIGTEPHGRIELSVRRRCRIRRSGLKVRSRPSIKPADIASQHDIPVTSIVLTLIDLATEYSLLRLERAVNEADKRDLIDPEVLRLALDQHRGEGGVPALRHVLDRHTFRLSDSDLEIFFRPIAMAAGLPPPLSKQIVNDFEVDFHWPGLGLVVETDGLRYHRTPSAQSRDAKRDRAHVIAGLAPLRFTHYEIRYEPLAVQTALEEAAAMVRRRLAL